MKMNEVVKELKNRQIKLDFVTIEDIKQIIRRAKSKDINKIVSNIQILEYNLTSEAINDYLGY